MISRNGDIWEGVVDHDIYFGKGELMHDDGTKEIGEWYRNCKHGKFEYYDQSGTLTHTKFYKFDEEVEGEEAEGEEAEGEEAEGEEAEQEI